MQCFIYKSVKKEFLYLYVTQQDDFSRVPAELLNHFGQLAFVIELDLTPERQLAREDSKKVIASLQEKGFFVQLPPRDDIFGDKL
jgi:uncharacterized protein YcgL (UPF0745 family)